MEQIINPSTFVGALTVGILASLIVAFLPIRKKKETLQKNVIKQKGEGNVAVQNSNLEARSNEK
ncbi:hypothetical protein ABE354_05100 [Brevibacillus laterosporus]|uniref:hypothetical protein n=1 Tax=Brevibacillus laterosporus TaxID=1465 RepID=UPI003D248006